MSGYLYYDTATGAPRSITANLYPVPAGMSLATFTDADYASFVSGNLAWDEPTRTLVGTNQATFQANLETILSQTAAALTANATYLALASPSAAQSTAQIKALTRQVNGLIRVTINALDATT